MGLFTSLAMAIALANATAGGPPRGEAQAAFGQLKELVGEWRGNRPDGGEVGVTYRLSAGDTVLVETWRLGPTKESMTIYHLDGDRLLATHYCPQGNQPRLALKRIKGSRFDFSFVDATGLMPGKAHQHEFWIELAADGAITRGETYIDGAQSESETITYRRVAG